MSFQNQPRRLNGDCWGGPGLTASVKFGFTLLEVLIVIALIVILAFAFLTLFNPKFQIEKGWDGKRKKELNTLQKVFEEYYNDNNCYPKPEEVCYDTPQLLFSGNYVCKICGNESAPSSFANFETYLSRLPCDPQHPNKDYLYEVDNATCPSLYRIYTRLSNEKDEVISEVGCTVGCAPEGYSVTLETAFNYGVTSPNTSLQIADTDVIQWACKTDYSCEACCYSGETNCPEGVPTCPNLPATGYCRIYAAYTSCTNDCQRAVDANDC